MTSQQILEKAIRKAIDGGWKGWRYFTTPTTTACTKRFLVMLPNKLGTSIWFSAEGVPTMSVNEKLVIFNHDFAKALWPIDGFEPVEAKAAQSTVTYSGKKMHMQRPGRPRKGSWQHHLQQMVIADDPIEYLSEHM